MSATDLDAVDEGIIYQLQQNARDRTTAHIGRQVGVSSSTVGNRIGKLEERGVITGYHPTVDYERAGLDHHLVVVGTVPFEDRETIGAEVANVTGVVCVRELLTGRQNVFVEVVGRTRGEIEECIATLHRRGVTVERTEMVEGERNQPYERFGRRAKDDTEAG